MGDVLFTFDVDATPDAVRRALTTTEGITSFWTDKADVPMEVGERSRWASGMHLHHSTWFLSRVMTP